MKRLISILTVLLVLASCRSSDVTSSWPIQKRKYMPGWHLNIPGRATTDKAAENQHYDKGKAEQIEKIIPSLAITNTQTLKDIEFQLPIKEPRGITAKGTVPEEENELQLQNNNTIPYWQYPPPDEETSKEERKRKRWNIFIGLLFFFVLLLFFFADFMLLIALGLMASVGVYRAVLIISPILAILSYIIYRYLKKKLYPVLANCFIASIVISSLIFVIVLIFAIIPFI